MEQLQVHWPTSKLTHTTMRFEFHSNRLDTFTTIEAHHYLAQLGILEFNKPVNFSKKILRKSEPIGHIPGAGDIVGSARAVLRHTSPVSTELFRQDEVVRFVAEHGAAGSSMIFVLLPRP